MRFFSMLVCFLKFYLFEQEQQKQKKNVQNEKVKLFSFLKIKSKVKLFSIRTYRLKQTFELAK